MRGRYSRMAAKQNRYRTRKRKNEQDSPWGSTVKSDLMSSADDTPLRPRHDRGESLPMAEDIQPAPMTGLRGWWRHFNFWPLLSGLIFIAFTGGIALLVVKLWTPQDMHDIAGYTDKGTARDLTSAITNSNGAELVFTEGEINRFLRDTCRLRQTGVFSVLAHAQGVAVRLHDGYAELIIDRVLSTHVHQTTAAHLSFVREMDNGLPKLRMEFRGGEPIAGAIAQGGSIGSVPVPRLFMKILIPALETIEDCYPEIFNAVEKYGYKPEFYRGRNEQEGYMRLVPYTP